MVVDLVNNTSAELLTLHPDLHIQFGLHASSVKTKLQYISKVDERVEIVWEDCGAFPFSYRPGWLDGYEETRAFAEEIVKQRPGAPLGLYYKGQLVMEWMEWEWGRFTHQTGPYILGEESKEVIKRDAELADILWKPYQKYWLDHGEEAYDMTNMILEVTGGNVNIGLAGQLAGKIRFATAFPAQMLWDPTESYADILARVMKRDSVSLV